MKVAFSLNIMVPDMIRPIHNLKIFNRIVKFIPVNVVNHFVRLKWSPQHILHFPSMLKLSYAIGLDDFITTNNKTALPIRMPFRNFIFLSMRSIAKVFSVRNIPKVNFPAFLTAVSAIVIKPTLGCFSITQIVAKLRLPYGEENIPARDAIASKNYSSLIKFTAVSNNRLYRSHVIAPFQKIRATAVDECQKHSRWPIEIEMPLARFVNGLIIT